MNNPIGISLTVASSFARRTEAFEERTEERQRITTLAARRIRQDLARRRPATGGQSAPRRRTHSVLQAGRGRPSHAERRTFNLNEATDQIIASLRPALKKASIALSVEVPENLVIDGYPGSYGQILTNLFLNAATHAFPRRALGDHATRPKPRGSDDVEIIFADDGAGMTPDVQRQAFDPFFTTRRNEGGTGLGLHIVYNLVTQQLGGRMMLDQGRDKAPRFALSCPKLAKGGSANRKPGSRQDFCMAEQDDVLHLIDDFGADLEISGGAQMEDRGHRRRSGGA